MSKSKKEHKANIISIKTAKKAAKKSAAITSEITRSLFSETWRNYLDEVYMVARSFNHTDIVKITSDPEVEKKSSTEQGPVLYSYSD